MRLVRLGALVTCAALVALAVVGCSNPSGGSDPTSSTHSWYYTVSVSTGSTVDVIYCINSSGGQDSPGTVTTPWTSPTYSATISSSTPREAIVLASLPSGVAGTITATIYEDGKQVAQVTGTGSGALAEPTHVL
ncbi:MAG: hypothetical protein ACLQMF_07270 [Rectinemataceae bacterium]